MAKKRTKKDKIKTREVTLNKKQGSVYSFSGFSKKKKQLDNQSFFGYDLALIYKDLTKTAVVTSIVVAVLLIILVYN